MDHVLISIDENAPSVSIFRRTHQWDHRTVVPGIVVDTFESVQHVLTPYAQYVFKTGRVTHEHFSSLSPIGAFLAHRSVWKRCSETQRSTWVFEQGVRDFAPDVLDTLDREYPSHDYISAFGNTSDENLLRRWTRMHPVKLNRSGTGSIPLWELGTIIIGCRCYRISPRFASVLLKQSELFDTHVDIFLSTVAMQGGMKCAWTGKNIVSACSSNTIKHTMVKSDVYKYGAIVLFIACLTLVVIKRRFRPMYDCPPCAAIGK